MPVLITGVAGFIGSHLADRLLEAQEEVVGLDVFDDFYDPAIKERNLEHARAFDSFRLVRGDVRDPETLARLPEHIDTIVHLAALVGVRASIDAPARYADVNVRGTAALLEFLRDRGIPRLVFGSSSSVYGKSGRRPFSESDAADRPLSPYGVTKRAGELLCHAHHALHGTAVLSVRLFTVYGPRQRPDLAIHKFAALMCAGQTLPVYGDGSSERDYTYIDDVVSGLTAAVRYLRAHPESSEIVNLGRGQPVPLLRMISVLARRLGVQPKIRHLPEQAAELVRTHADLSVARRLLGYEPATRLEVGIDRFVSWLEGERRG